MPARLDSGVIDSAVRSFPSGDGWTTLQCNLIGRTGNARLADWKPIAHVRRIGGVYAFLLPASCFASVRTIHLHGPKKSEIPFDFTLEPATPDGLAVVYVGRTTNLAQRFRGHLTLGKRKDGGQVKYGLWDARVCLDEATALSFLREHGRIVYRILDGAEQTVNRDIIELSLCARHRPPFNIKSER
jgi:hypothetical protein